MDQTPEKFDQWGIVEVMGHKQFAGHITEQVIAGSALVRVDVPAVTSGGGTEYNAFTKLIGVGSIYCITPTTEEIARKAARAMAGDDAALPVYIPEDRQIPARVPVPDYDDDPAWSEDEPLPFP
jgi:hypothetical protein